MKKGFTLIELLAVIVILAIIALIATPIILGIINDARNSARKRSAELAVTSIEYAVTSYLYNNGGNADNLTLEDIGDYFKAENVEFVEEDDEYYIKENGTNGYVLCTVEQSNGNIIVDCGDYAVPKTIPYSTPTQLSKPEYYTSQITGLNLGDNLPEDKTTTPSFFYDVYLGYKGDAQGKITAAYVCFTLDAKEYCLEGYDKNSYGANVNTLNSAIGEEKCTLGESYECTDTATYATVDSNGNVRVNIGTSNCYVYSNGYSKCEAGKS